MGQCLSRQRKISPVVKNGEGASTSDSGKEKTSGATSSGIGKKVALPPLRNTPPRYHYRPKQPVKVKKNVSWNETKLATNIVESFVLGAERAHEIEKLPDITKPPPFWILGDVPIKPVNLPTIEDIQVNMKTIESQMQALLRPEEKYLQRSCAFAIGKVDTARPETPACVPQRLLKQQKAEANRKKMQEKQLEAERRRNANIAQRVQSARRRATAKVAPEVVQEKEREREREIAMKVENKMKAAQERRKEIMREFWARAAEQEAKSKLVKSRAKEIAIAQKDKEHAHEVKAGKMTENRKKALKKRLTALKFQDKRRQSILKRLAKQREEEEEECHKFVETETYDADDDLGEHDWE